MNWLEVNDTLLRYDLREAAFEARPSDAAVPTLVLIHEMGGTLESWDALFADFPAHVRLLRYDVRGAGLSEKIRGEVDIDTHADDLLALLDALQLSSRVALVGVAVGAAIAIRFAARHPQRVSQLVGMAPACGVPASAREATLARAAAIRRDGLRELIPALLDKTWPAVLRDDLQVFEQYRLRWTAGDPDSFAAIFAMLAGMNLEADLPQMPARTLLVAGEYDGLRPPAEIDRLAAFAPQIEALHVASGHFMPVQTPLLVLTLLCEYLLEGRSGAASYKTFCAAQECAAQDSP